MKTIALILWLSGSIQGAETLRLHFKPEDHALGDVHPFFHEGECFLYYLKPGQFGGLLDGKDLCAAQIAPDSKGHLRLYGWIPLTPATAEKQDWGGHLALVREVHAPPDGSLATRLAPEVASAIDKLAWMPADTAAEVPLNEGQRFGARCKLSCIPGSRGGFELRFPPLGKVVYSANHLAIQDAPGVSWSESEFVPPASGFWDFSVLVEDDRVEVFAADRHSLCARLPAAKSAAHLTFHATGDAFEVTDFQFSLLQSPP